MCTVIIHVPHRADAPTRVLAVRDEDPSRTWDPLGPWWPDTHPGVIGVRDSRAGGAWLAADAATGRLAVILNRADVEGLAPEDLRSRGGVVLDAVEGSVPEENPRTHGFNLVEVTAGAARVTMWDGAALRTTDLAPGTHMIAHDDVDDAHTPRIATWRTAFADHEPDAAASGSWWQPWLDTLERSAHLDPADDRAIVRDNRAHGYPTLSLLVCVASVGVDGVEVQYGAFDRPGVWNRPTLA